MDQYKYHYARAIKLLARRPRSEKEVRDNLLKKSAQGRDLASGGKKIPPEVLENIINKLKEQKFVNDEEFAAWWIEQRTRVTPRSMRLIRFELLQKGIQKDVIESAVSGQELAVDEMSTARKIVEKKFPKYKSLSREEIYQMLGGHLARKGYNWDVIKRSIDAAIGKKV